MNKKMWYIYVYIYMYVYMYAYVYEYYSVIKKNENFPFVAT